VPFPLGSFGRERADFGTGKYARLGQVIDREPWVCHHLFEQIGMLCFEVGHHRQNMDEAEARGAQWEHNLASPGDLYRHHRAGRAGVEGHVGHPRRAPMPPTLSWYEGLAK
jgi:hypothetical protein